MNESASVCEKNLNLARMPEVQLRMGDGTHNRLLKKPGTIDLLIRLWLTQWLYIVLLSLITGQLTYIPVRLNPVQ
jgi:hypothetical protein